MKTTKLTIWTPWIQNLLTSGDMTNVRLGMCLLEDKMTAIHWYSLPEETCQRFSLPYLEEQSWDEGGTYANMTAMMPDNRGPYGYYDVDRANYINKAFYEY